jgi:hypothetical protein|uniref:Uncharacterized protein n=1 Tax=Picea glauca TaxID=3330 RepID=A0A124GN97_PICGL|nr:hypothetical protein ABT39_MTgene5152 [Picea glauca]QHR91196.1 hypothetical protein Q903MT_gene5228 [Picea sitchensis]
MGWWSSSQGLLVACSCRDGPEREGLPLAYIFNCRPDGLRLWSIREPRWMDKLMNARREMPRQSQSGYAL